MLQGCETMNGGGTENYKESLKAIIRERTRFITGDCDTFLHVKRQATPLIGEWGSGGGNFLMAIGLFALINFLAKAHRYLVKPSQFVTSEYHADLTASRRRIRKLITKDNDGDFVRTDKDYVRRYFTARVGDAFNEAQTFSTFVSVLQQNNINFGIPNKEVSEHLWFVFRNALTHMAMTRQASVAAYDNIHGLTITASMVILRKLGIMERR
jgi:hypothetical protein